MEFLKLLERIEKAKVRYLVIDVFVRHPLPFEAMYKRRERIKVGRTKISVIAIPDLIRLKQKAGRLQDLSDIEALKKVLKWKKEWDL